MQNYRISLNNSRFSPIFYNFAEDLKDFKLFRTSVSIFRIECPENKGGILQNNDQKSIEKI